MSRADVTDPGSIPTYHSEPPGYAAEPTPSFGSAPGFGNEPAYGSEPLPSYGSQGQDGFGDDPLNTGERTYTPPPAPSAPAAPAPAAGAAGADGDRLPSVDELLARIQSDRKKAAQETEAQQYASLADPLNDPLAIGERSYGSASTSGGWPASPDPLNTAQPSHGYDGGYGTAASGSGYGNDGYGGQPRAGRTPSAAGMPVRSPPTVPMAVVNTPRHNSRAPTPTFPEAPTTARVTAADYSSGQPSETHGAREHDPGIPDQSVQQLQSGRRSVPTSGATPTAATSAAELLPAAVPLGVLRQVCPTRRRGHARGDGA